MQSFSRLPFGRSWFPAAPVWRQAVRMTVAALLAYAGAAWFGLAEGHWAVITCLVVVQNTLGETLDAGLSRLKGTIAGAVLGGAGVWLENRTAIPHGVVLFALVLPLSLLAAANLQFRMAPVTAALVLLAIPAGGRSFAVALDRIAEIGLGGFVGIVTAAVVLPDRGAGQMRTHASAALRTLGKLARSYLAGTGGTDALGERLQAQIRKLQTACAAAQRERAFRLAAGPAPEPLLRTIRRLRTDVMMIGRVVSADPGAEIGGTAALADAVASWFAAAADALAHEGAPPDPAALDRAGECAAPGTAMGLAYAVLCRDLSDLSERIAERSRSARIF